MSELSIEVEDLPGVAGAKKVALNGAVDAKTVLALKSEIASQVERGADRFVVDMRQVKYVNSTGLSYFITLAGNGDRLALAMMQPRVKVVFDMMGLGSLLKIVETVEEGARHLSASAPPPAPAPAKPEPAAPAGAPSRSGVRWALAVVLLLLVLLGAGLYVAGILP